MRSEFRIWWSLVWPTLITNFCRMGMELTDVLVLGHYKGGTYLAKASYAQVVISSVIVIVSRGMGGSVVSALCSTAYGAGNYRLMGIWLQTALLLCSCVGVLLMPVWFWGGEILQLILGDATIKASDVQDIDLFLRISIFWMLPRCWNSCLDPFLSAQKVVFPQMLVAMMGFIFNICANFAFVYGADLGYAGSPCATGLSRWCTLLALVILIYRYPSFLPVSSWAGCSIRESIEPQRMKCYLTQAVPAALTGIVEEYQFQTLTVFAGHLGTNVVATHNSFFTMVMLLCSAMWALMNSTVVRMGHHLGQGNMAGVRIVIKIGVCGAVTYGILVTMTLSIFRKQVGELLSSNPDVRDLADEIAVLVGSCFFLLALFYSFMAMLTASFKQHLIGIVFVVGAWGVSVPLGWLFAFKVNPDAGSWYPGRRSWDVGPGDNGIGLLGLWLGMAIGYVTTTCFAGFVVCRIRWPQIIEEARRRAEVKESQSGLSLQQPDVPQ